MPRGEGGPFGDGRAALWGLPISVKDCFDLAGAPTSCGVHFYRDLNGIAARDSWLVEQLRAAGAVITGKTHLHPLAYGITGENPEFGDCVQPRDARRRSPAALRAAQPPACRRARPWPPSAPIPAAPIRVPAALCGLAGYRASLGRGDWRGGAHLAESFDTMGWLFRDLEDAPLLAAPFAPADAPRAQSIHPLRLCRRQFSPRLRAGDRQPAFAPPIRELQDAGAARREPSSAEWWAESIEIFAPHAGMGGGAHPRRQLRPLSSRPFANGWSGARA